ncbi:MAG TPA: 50S ribosomal protein L2 [Candidatus Nanoarchaeia archaeon]|nr:50S ribosomal protein L2 [Candidatus Nanoarchaeia archaeon]
MGKNLIQQKRGKGSSTYRAPSFKYVGRAKYGTYGNLPSKGTITDIIHCPGHSAPLISVKYDNGSDVLLQAAEGLKVGSEVATGDGASLMPGNVLALKDIPEGTDVFNIESMPGDGGKFVRASGTMAKVIAKSNDKIILILPSKKQRNFSPMCRATIGIIAGAGKKEKPFLKAGFKMHAMRARNKIYPKVAGLAMNAVDHPFGGSSTNAKGKCSTVSRDAPPGRKVGKIAARRTGRKRR